MRSVSSGLGFAMLLLVQILAPLLHVHTSGNDGGIKALHIPGLESLYFAHNKAMQSAHAEQADGFVVGIAEGLPRSLDAGMLFASSDDLPWSVSPFLLSSVFTSDPFSNSNLRAVIRYRSVVSPPPRGPPA